jgi:hypothetical protein
MDTDIKISFQVKGAGAQYRLYEAPSLLWVTGRPKTYSTELEWHLAIISYVTQKTSLGTHLCPYFHIRSIANILDEWLSRRRDQSFG